MKLALVGSRFFGATVFEALRKEPGVQITGVVAPAVDDRLALAAKAAGVAVHVLANPKVVPGEAIAEGSDLIVAAHTHARVSDEALARAKLGGVGYHPSLLPRHRGIAAVEWTILQGDAIAGGSVYHLADGWDLGAIAAQDWCFVAKGETARDLWERALAPMGLRLLAQVVHQAGVDGRLPALPQDPRFATRAPMIRRAVMLTDDAPTATVPMVVTVIGADRPGIVSQLSDCAQRFGANWTTSHMTRLAGEFAGVVHLDAPSAQADALAEALHALESAGLRVAVARSSGADVAAGMRGLTLELMGADRVGILSQLAALLAERSISIEHLDTEVVTAAADGRPRFKVSAHLLVPASWTNEALRKALEPLAGELMLDIALGDRPAGASMPG